jgi:hypothetical protein
MLEPPVILITKVNCDNETSGAGKTSGTPMERTEIKTAYRNWKGMPFATLFISHDRDNDPTVGYIPYKEVFRMCNKSSETSHLSREEPTFLSGLNW